MIALYVVIRCKFVKEKHFNLIPKAKSRALRLFCILNTITRIKQLPMCICASVAYKKICAIKRIGKLFMNNSLSVLIGNS